MTTAKRKHIAILLTINKINKNFELRNKICYLENKEVKFWMTIFGGNSQ